MYLGGRETACLEKRNKGIAKTSLQTSLLFLSSFSQASIAIIISSLFFPWSESGGGGNFLVKVLFPSLSLVRISYLPPPRPHPSHFFPQKRTRHKTPVVQKHSLASSGRRAQMVSLKKPFPSFLSSLYGTMLPFFNCWTLRGDNFFLENHLISRKKRRKIKIAFRTCDLA